MITRATIKQLEKRYNRISNKDNVIVVRHVTQDNKLMDQEGYLLSEDEVKRVKKEDEKVENGRGLVVYLTSYGEPKTRAA